MKISGRSRCVQYIEETRMMATSDLLASTDIKVFGCTYLFTMLLLIDCHIKNFVVKGRTL